MKKSKTLLFTLAIILLSCGEFEGGTSKTMQEDFDKIRLDETVYLYEKIEEFKSKTGILPFQNLSDTIPVVVVFETNQQAKGHRGRYPIIVDLDTRFSNKDSIVQPPRINIKETPDFYSLIIDSGKVDLKIVKDPQKVPTRKPCLYIYTIYKDVFDISCFLHNNYKFTRNLSPFNSKFCLTSAENSNPSMGILTFNDFKFNGVVDSLSHDKFNRGGYIFKSDFYKETKSQ